MSGPLPVLELTGLAHRFGRRWVLRGLDLSVAPGEVVAIGGPNGAGKTTLLRVAATLLRPTRGEGRVEGLELVREAGRARERLAYLGHAPALYEDLTAAENLAFAFRMKRHPSDPATVRAALAGVGLEAHAQARVRKFSSGMRRRIALARVLHPLPTLLLMDEPYASLDPDGVELVNDGIRRVVGSGGGVLMATHDFRAGASLTDRVVELRDGRLAAADLAHMPGPPPTPGPAGRRATGAQARAEARTEAGAEASDQAGRARSASA